MVMTNEEIVRDYLQARNKSKQIRILADLNQTTKAEIRQILASEGAEAVEANKRPLKPLNPKMKNDTAEKLEAPKTEIYGQIEAILAELPEDMGVKARWAAGKMLAEMFAEYLKMRLRLEAKEGRHEKKRISPAAGAQERAQARSALPAEDGYAPADVRGRGIPGGGGRV